MNTSLAIEKGKMEILCSEGQSVEMVPINGQVAYVRIIGKTGEEGNIKGIFSRVTVRNVKQDRANEPETGNQERMNEHATG